MILPKARRERRERIAAYCKRLSWSQTAVALCEQAAPMQEVFLEEVMAAELANREVGRRARLMSRAGFPAHKTLADFDRRVAQLPSTLTWEDLEQGTFIGDHRNLVFFGGVGLGKTHLSTALGLAACERGQTVRFFTVTGLVVRLTEALKTGTLERAFMELQRTDLLILDEWGYLPIDTRGCPTAVSGGGGQLRNPKPHPHHELGIFQVGHGVHRRPDDRRYDRPTGTPWAFGAVRRRELPDAARLDEGAVTMTPTGKIRSIRWVPWWDARPSCSHGPACG